MSFFTDVSTEMIYPLLPVFLASVLGANASFIGAIEGVAETTASLLKLVSGWWSDRVGSRKRLVVTFTALQCVLTVAFGFVMVNLIVDLLYAILDPRISYA